MTDLSERLRRWVEAAQAHHLAHVDDEQVEHVLAELAPDVDVEAPLASVALGDAYERWLAAHDPHARKTGGRYYTPPEVVERLLDEALEPLLADALQQPPERRADALLELTLFDPSCGAGAFLVAAARRIAAKLVQHAGLGRDEALTAVVERSIHGTDVDPVAAVLCSEALALECGGQARPNVTRTDALTALEFQPSLLPKSMGRGDFDLVLGNPPFVDAETMSREWPGARLLIPSLWPSARGNWDLFVPFVELGLDLLRPGGHLGFVTPTKLLASDYAAAIQKRLLDETPLAFIDLTAQPLFADADVDVLLAVVKRAAPSPEHRVSFVPTSGPARPIPLATLRRLPPGFIAFLLVEQDTTLLALLERGEPLGSLARLSDGATTAEAYRIRDVVIDANEDVPEGRAVRLVNTGTIDPFHLRWGRRPIRYLGSIALRPVVPLDWLERELPRRASQAASSKVVVAGLSKRLEAAVAPAGILCGKSATVVVPAPGICPDALAAVLNAEVMGRLYRGLFGRRGLGGEALAVGPRQLARLPMPARDRLAPAPEGPEEALRFVAAAPHRLFSRPDHLSLLGRALRACAGADATLVAAVDEAVQRAFEL